MHPFVEDRAAFEALGARTIAMLGEYLRALPAQPVDRVVPEEVRRRLMSLPLPEQGQAAEDILEFLRREIMLRLAARLGDADDAELRAELAASQVVGIIMVRHILAFEPVASMSDEEIVARVAPAIQFHLTGDHHMLDSAPAPAKNSAHDE